MDEFSVVAGHPPRSFEGVKELVTAARGFIEGWNDRGHPFTWSRIADESLPLATRQRDADARH